MILKVDHSTSHSYDCAVALEPHPFALQLKVLPAPSGYTECLDQDANPGLHALFDAPVTDLTVTSRFRVELPRASPFGFNLSTEPLGYRYPLSALLSSYSNALNVELGTRLGMQVDSE